MSKKNDKNLTSKDIILFDNYDYISENNNKTNPGVGFYNGKMNKYKSVKEFIENRKVKNKKIKNAINDRILMFLTIGDNDE